MLKELRCLGDGHLQHIRDRMPAVANLQSRGIKPLAKAGIAGNINVGQKAHLHFLHARALTILAAPTFDVEREAALIKAVDLRLWQGSKELPDMIKDFGIRRRVASRRAPNRTLIDLHDLIKAL